MILLHAAGAPLLLCVGLPAAQPDLAVDSVAQFLAACRHVATLDLVSQLSRFVQSMPAHHTPNTQNRPSAGQELPAFLIHTSLLNIYYH